MKARSYFEQSADPTLDPNETGRRGRDSRDDFQQRGFSRAIGSDNCDGLPLLKFEGDVFQSPEVAFFLGLSAPSEVLYFPFFGQLASSTNDECLRAAAPG